MGLRPKWAEVSLWPRLLPATGLGTAKDFRKLVRASRQSGLVLWAARNERQLGPSPNGRLA